MISVFAHVASAEMEDGVVREALMEVGGLRASEDGDRHVKWLQEALVPGDEIEVRVTEVESPTRCHEELAWPEPAAECPTGIEVLLNGLVVATTGTPQSNGAALAVVTWSRGAKTELPPGEYVHLDVGRHYSKLLAVGDTVVIRMLGG